MQLHALSLDLMIFGITKAYPDILTSWSAAQYVFHSLNRESLSLKLS